MAVAQLGLTGLALPIEVSFHVPGRPATAGSKRPLAGKRADGTIWARAVEGDNRAAQERKQAWRTDVRAAAEAAMEEVGWERVSGDLPLELRLVIVRKRPSSHIRTGRWKGSVKPNHLADRPTTRPDSTKILRAAEDALTGIIWTDDAQVVDSSIHKVFADHIGWPVDSEGVIVTVAHARPTTPPLPGS